MTYVRLDARTPRGCIARTPLLREWAWRGRSLAAAALIFTGALLCRVNVHGGDFVRADATSTGVVVYNTEARDASKSSSQQFAVDPNFLCYTPAALQITVVTRRNAAGDNAGFNLKYESRTGWKTAGGAWYTVPDNTQWHTRTWTITDDQFVSVWGFNFRLDSDATTYSRYYLRSVTVAKTGK